MSLRRSVAVALILVMPAASLAQVTIDHTQLDRVRTRLSERSLLAELDRYLDVETMQAVPCADATLQGRHDAAEQHHARWWWLSGAVGFLLPIIGIGLSTGVAALSHPIPNLTPANLDGRCYRDGYGDRAKKRNVLTALGASTIGTVAIIVLVVASGGFAVFPAAPTAAGPRP